jgi:hypothetical protein
MLLLLLVTVPLYVIAGYVRVWCGAERSGVNSTQEQVSVYSLLCTTHTHTHTHMHARTWRTRIAWCLTKVTDTHSDYVIIIAFLRQQRLRERATMLRLYVHCVSCHTSC